MVWNFIEYVFYLNLYNDDFLKPSISQFVNLYGNWYKNNQNLYGDRLQRFIKKTYNI